MNIYKEYCTGCGLCKSLRKSDIELTEKGFREISSTDGIDFDFANICVAGGIQCKDMDRYKIWGREKGVFLAYSEDELIRKSASSGGVLTTIAIYLLQNHKVDGVIQICQSDVDPIETNVVCSRTKEDVLKCMGSRYSASMPLENIIQLLNKEEVYAFIGKPCDVTTLRNYVNTNEEYKQKIPYMLSFFCAGAPSRNANIRLLNKLQCNEHNCTYLRYRGEGWPGFATATNSSGQTSKITYREAWRDTLGRDIRKICRLCLDGIGEMADISCGDAWYLDRNNEPIFEENDGRNVVFCRTEKGRELFDEVTLSGDLCASNYDDYEREIQYYQKYQFERRSTMSTVFLALKLFGKKTPKYDKELLQHYAKKADKIMRWRRFKGTVKRIIQNKI